MGISGTLTGTRVYAPSGDRREPDEVVAQDSPNFGVCLRARPDRMGDARRKLSIARSSVVRLVKCTYEMQHDEQGSISFQHFEVANGAVPGFTDPRIRPRVSASVVHFSSGTSGASKRRSKVSIGSIGRVTEFGSSKDTSAILSDSNWNACRHQKQLVED